MSDELKRLEQEAKAWDEEVARAEDRGNEVAAARWRARAIQAWERYFRAA